MGKAVAVGENEVTAPSATFNPSTSVESNLYCKQRISLTPKRATITTASSSLEFKGGFCRHVVTSRITEICILRMIGTKNSGLDASLALKIFFTL